MCFLILNPNSKKRERVFEGEWFPDMRGSPQAEGPRHGSGWAEQLRGTRQNHASEEQQHPTSVGIQDLFLPAA